MTEAPRITSEQMQQVMQQVAAGRDDLSIHIATKVPEEQIARLRASAKKSTPRRSR